MGGLLQELETFSRYSPGAGQVLGNLLVALACGYAVSRLYAWTNRRLGYTGAFAHALVTLAMITAVVIMVIGNNLARAFGLVGAMSIIRFRTAVKDIQDIVFIFFSLAVGMAAGAGLATIALVGTLTVGAVTLALAQARVLTGKTREYLLQFSLAPGPAGEAPYLPVLGQYCRRHHLVNTRARDGQGMLDLSFYVLLKRQDQRDQLVLDLMKVQGVRNVHLFADEENL
jgi:uncharacterized membrane protein YhiD involved in acid resistance